MDISVNTNAVLPEQSTLSLLLKSATIEGSVLNKTVAVSAAQLYKLATISCTSTLSSLFIIVNGLLYLSNVLAIVALETGCKIRHVYAPFIFG